MFQDMDQDIFGLNMLHFVDIQNFEYIQGDKWVGFLCNLGHTSKRLDRLFLYTDYSVHTVKGDTDFE